MTEIEKMYENCNYRFKGKSCTDCPLKCKGKEREPQRLKQENEELRKSLKTWQYSDQQHLLKIIKYEKTLEEIREIANQKYDCVNSEVMCCRLCERLELIMTKINEALDEN